MGRRKATGNFRRKNTHRSLRSEPGELDDCLVDAEAREDLWEKLRAYADFARAFGPQGTALDAGQPWWIHPYASPLGEVRILGFNTVLLSFDDQDEKRLALGKRQIKSIPDQDTPDGHLLVVLQHHPWEWLHDGMEQRRWLGSRPHLFFCGHIHQPEGIVGLRLDGQAHLVLVAGAGHGEAGEPPAHGYAWGRLTWEGK